jgi:hypothetical protein
MLCGSGVDGVSSLLLVPAILLAGLGAALSLIPLSDFPGPHHCKNAKMPLSWCSFDTAFG